MVSWNVKKCKLNITDIKLMVLPSVIILNKIKAEIKSRQNTLE